MLSLSAYLGLFLSAFGAATLLPLQSEALLVALLLGEQQPWWILLAVASAGNVLGAQVNWLLGRYLERFRQRRWFPLSPRQLEQAQHCYGRYGCGTLLLSWLPLVGDPLTLVAGLMREPWWRFLLLVGLAKTGRYAVLAYLTLSLA